MTITIGFSPYEPGADRVADAIYRRATPEQREQFCYPHTFLLLGNNLLGYHRIELWTTGVGYAWHPQPTPGLLFSLDDPERELYAVHSAMHPSTPACRTDFKQSLAQVKYGEASTKPDFQRGLFTCSSFVLHHLQMLWAPHRIDLLIQWLRTNNDIFTEILRD